jgi:cell division protein FtsI/penicillin-binding protein 2
MILVTEGARGTAHRSRVPGYHVAGKTGTAENPHGEAHSWYVGYVPAEDPVIAVAVICENAGHGSDVAAPIAGALFRARLLDSEEPRNAEGPQIAQGGGIGSAEP